MAQDPYTLAPQAYKKQLENEWVRVTKVHYAPNEKIAEHGHPVLCENPAEDGSPKIGVSTPSRRRVPREPRPI